MIGRRKGYRVALVMPDNVTNERRQMAALFGAEVIDSPGALGFERRHRPGQAPRQQGRAVRDAVPVRQPGQRRSPTTRRPARRSSPTAPRSTCSSPGWARRHADGRLALHARAQAGRPDRGRRATPRRAGPGPAVAGRRDSSRRSSSPSSSTRSTSSRTATRSRPCATSSSRRGSSPGRRAARCWCAAAREAQTMTSGTIVALLPDGGWKYLSAGTFSANLDEMEEALEGGVNWW